MNINSGREREGDAFLSKYTYLEKNCLSAPALLRMKKTIEEGCIDSDFRHDSDFGNNFEL